MASSSSGRSQAKTAELSPGTAVSPVGVCGHQGPADSLADAEGVAEGVAEGELDGDAEGDADGDADGELDGEGVSNGADDGLGAALSDALSDALADALADALVDALADALADALEGAVVDDSAVAGRSAVRAAGETLAGTSLDPLGVGSALADSDADADTDALGLADADADTDALGLAVGLALGLADALASGRTTHGPSTSLRTSPGTSLAGRVSLTAGTAGANSSARATPVELNIEINSAKITLIETVIKVRRRAQKRPRHGAGTYEAIMGARVLNRGFCSSHQCHPRFDLHVAISRPLFCGHLGKNS